MIICIILSPDKSDKSKKSASLKWLFYCAVAFVFTGSIGVIQKIHQNSEIHKSEKSTLLITCFFVSAILAGIRLLREKYKNKGYIEKPTFSKASLFIPLITGLCFAFPHTINLFLAGKLPSVLFFPTVNLCPMMLNMLFAIFLFKERLSLKRWVGVGIGILSTVFVSGIFN